MANLGVFLAMLLIVFAILLASEPGPHPLAAIWRRLRRRQPSRFPLRRPFSDGKWR